jgi:hypothetical protein
MHFDALRRQNGRCITDVVKMMLNRGGVGDALEAVAGDAVRISPCDDAFTDDDTCSKSVHLSTAFFL